MPLVRTKKPQRSFSIGLAGAAGMLALALTTTRARAEEGGDPPTVTDWSPESAAAETKVWYGMPILITDLAALGAFVGGTLAADRDAEVGWGFILAGTGAYLLGGPIVHLKERGPRAGFRSLGLRAAAPVAGLLTGAIVGGAIGSRAKCGSDDTCGLGGFLIGGAIGFVGGALAAMFVDNAKFAYKRTPTASSIAVTPIYVPSRRQSGIALRGTW